jgi:anti-sigma-K factor RskA
MPWTVEEGRELTVGETRRQRRRIRGEAEISGILLRWRRHVGELGNDYTSGASPAATETSDSTTA